MKANLITFVRGLKKGTPPRFQSYLKSLILLLVMLMSVNMWGETKTYTMTTSGSQSTTIENNWTANSKASFNTSGAYWSCNSNNNTFTITSGNNITGNITKVQVTGKRNKASKTYTIDVKVGDKTLGSQFSQSGNSTYDTETTFSDATGLSGTIVITVNAAGASSDGGSFWITSILVTTAAAVPVTSLILSEAGTETDYKSGKNVGDKYTLLDEKYVTAECGDKTFVGWSTETVDSPTEPTSNFYAPGAEVTLAANNTFYAVFADAQDLGGKVYKKVSSVSAGTYVLVSEKTTNTFKYMPNTESSGSNPTLGSGITMTTSGGVTKLTNSVTDAMLWDLTSTGTTNEYYIRPKGSTTIGLGTTNSTGENIRISSTYKNTKWTITTSTSYNWQFKNNNTTEMYLAVYADNAWRNYSNSTTNQNGKFYLFKEEANISYSNYTTTCAAPRDIDHIEVTGTPATFWKGDEFNHTGMTVKAYYTEGDPDDVTGSATFSGYDMSTPGEQTITVTYKGKTDTYTINVQTIANTQATAYTVAQAKAIIDAGKDLATQVYVTGTVSKIVTAFSESNGYVSFNVSADGNTTGDQFQFYHNFKGANKTKWTTSDLIPEVADEVIGFGTLKKFNNSTYEFDEGNYLVSLSRTKKLTSITVSGTPDYFDTSMEFNHNGMTVTAHYNTGASDDADVTASAVFTAPDMTTQGEKTVNVSYTEEGITKETSYPIQVAQYCANVVTITKGDEENGTFSLSQTGNICADGGLTISVTDIVPAEHYHFKEITTTNGTVNDKTVTGITDDAIITVVFEEDTKYDVKWMVSGEQMGATAMLYEGDDVTAPTGTVTVPEACANEGKVFVGWTAIKDYEHATDAPTFFAPHKMGTANETYYAVFATKGAEGAATTEELTKNEIQSITNPKLAYTTEKTYSGSTLSYSIYGYTDQASRPWIQLKKDQAAYIKVTAPEDIKQIELTITSVSNTSGGITDITKHTAYSGSVGLVTTDCTFSTDSKNVGITSTITNNKATITTTESTKEVMIKVTTGARIWGIKTTYGAGATYSDYVTSCVIPTYSVTIQSNNTTMGSVTVDPEITEDAYAAETEFIVEATAEEGYRFVNWTISDNNEGASLSEAATEAVNIFTTGAADVTLTANFEAIPADPITVTLEVGEHGALDCVDCVNNTITEETAGEGVLVPNVTANEGWAFLGWSTSSTATEAQYEVADIFLPSDDNKTLYAVYAQLYKVTLKYTDEVKWQTTAGGAIALPSRDCKNETYKDHFAGWSITEFAEETTNPTETPTIYPVGDFVPTADITLYPVFSITAETTQWKKVAASAISETGVYALLGDNNYPFNGKISEGKGQQTDNAFEFVNNVATSAPEGTCELTMTFNSSKCSMYNTDKGYLYPKDNTSGNLAWSTTVYDQWTYYSDQSTWEYKISSGKYAHLRSNNSQFNTYNSTGYGTLISFAKKETTSVGKYWSKPANDVTNPVLDTPAGDYLSPLTVKITDASYDVNLIYYYTTDGTTPAADELLEPTGTSTMYEPTTGIVLQPAQTFNLQVIGYDEDGYTSQIASATYVLYPIFNSISDMYAGATNDKPVGLVLTNAYVHAVNTIGQNSQIFVQQGDLGVVLSTTTVPEGVAAGKQISGTATGTYKITNGRPQISSFAFQSTFSVSDGTRPEPIKIDATTIDKVSTNLLGLVKLEGVYAQSEASNVIVVNSNAEGTGTSMNVYDFFNKVSTIPASDVKCNVIGLFNERQNNSDPIVYSVMPVLATDFDVVEKQDAQLPTVSPLGSTVEAEPLGVANGEQITITPVAGFTTSYKVNDAAEWTTTPLYFNISETNTKLEIKATRPYYNDASATYYYEIDPGLTKYHITLPSVQTYYKIVSDVTDQKAGETVTLTISNITEHWNITGVTVEKADDETTTVEVANPETNKYTFVMPAYAVNVKVSYKSDPTYSIDYLRGITGSTGDNITESKQYAGVELALKECTWKAAGYTFKNWYAYYLDDESQEVAITITDNKVIVPAHDVKVKAMWDEAAWHKEGTWELVTTTTELGVGDYVIFTETKNAGTESDRLAGTSTVKKAGEQLAVTNNIAIADNKLTRLNNDGSMVFQVEEGNVENTYAFYADGIGYLNANGDVADKNYMITSESKESNNASWAIESIDATTGEAVVKAKSSKRNMMQMNTTSSIFAAYGSKQGGLAIYKFYPKAWTVTFDDNVEGEEIAVPDMQRADPTTNKVTISTMVPERTGYEFSKWNSAKGGTGELTANPGDEITLTANKTLYAQWNIKQYNVAVAEVDNVTIQAKPYSEEAIAEGANANVNFKKSVVLTYSDVNEEYVFKSWKVTKADDETIVVPISVGSSTTFEVPAYDVTVSAVIESKATTQLTVTYHANGGKNKTPEEPEEIETSVGYNTVLQFSADNCPFEKEFCVFDGWNTKADGSGTTYKTQHTVKSDINLYAMWKGTGVQYRVETSNSVSVTKGAVPEQSTATFVNTYTTATQLTATHSMTLTLSGYDGKVITGISLSTKSNSSAGAGTYEVKIGDRTIFTATGSYHDIWGGWWNSSFESQDLAIAKTLVQEGEDIVIKISATENSLHCQSFTIHYVTPDYTRTFSNSNVSTVCVPYAVKPEDRFGAQFYEIAYKEAADDYCKIFFDEVAADETLVAGKPYVIIPEGGTLALIYSGSKVTYPVDGEKGLTGTFVNITDGVAGAAGNVLEGNYIFSQNKYWLCKGNCGLDPYRAYIKYDEINADFTPVAPVPGRRRISMGTAGLEDVDTSGNTEITTDLNRINAEHIVRKMIINDKMYILRAGKMYNAAGALMK